MFNEIPFHFLLHSHPLNHSNSSSLLLIFRKLAAFVKLYFYKFDIFVCISFSWGIIVYAKEFELEGLWWVIANLVQFIIVGALTGAVVSMFDRGTRKQS